MIDKEKVTFYDLQWDTDYFGILCAKAILHKPLDMNQWKKVKERFANYQFVSIENKNSEPTNAWLIGRDTKAFLVDVNIQFKKELENNYDIPETVKIYQGMKLNEKILDMADFKISKFTEDLELVKRGGKDVYRHWLINSFDREDKHFAVSRDSDGEINGFLLHSYLDNICIVELITVSSGKTSGGVGTELFKAIEYMACEYSCEEIKVGTQIRNLLAINFYHKVGCKQVGCHQVYHLWDLED
ncbi:MAG: GNAT family N-acetyltransferase [Clostridia bacterium]|nr:GNAT family N-acetyltransferase [Clostridia bacterium]